MSQKLTSTFINHFKMIISLNKWRISCEGIFSQNIIRMKAWNSASRKKNKSYWLCPAAVYWYLNSHVTTEEFWERCFSSCHERGTNKKFWVPMRNRKYQNKSFKHCHSFLKRNAMDFHKQLKSWKRLKIEEFAVKKNFYTLCRWSRITIRWLLGTLRMLIKKLKLAKLYSHMYVWMWPIHL